MPTSSKAKSSVVVKFAGALGLELRKPGLGERKEES